MNRTALIALVLASSAQAEPDRRYTVDEVRAMASGFARGIDVAITSESAPLITHGASLLVDGCNMSESERLPLATKAASAIETGGTISEREAAAFLCEVVQR